MEICIQQKTGLTVISQQADLVGTVMAISIEKAKELLLGKKSELEDLSQISEGSRDTVMLDQQSVGRLSRMDALQMQAMAEASERQRQQQLAKIESALERIEKGEYGYCLRCDEEIEEKRLLADPAATICIDCARK